MKTPLFVAAALLATVLSGCTTPVDGPESASGDASESAQGPAYGSLSVYLKDAPTDNFSEVHIVVESVEVHLAGPSKNATDGNETAESEGNETAAPDGNQTSAPQGNETADDEPDDLAARDCKGKWVTVHNETTDIDLLETQGDLAVFLGEVSLPACKVTQIRLHTSSAYGIDEDGNRTEISLANPVLKVVRSFDVEPGAEQQVVIDVDLDHSLKQKGPDGAWSLKPVLGKATKVTVVDDDESGEETAETGDIQSV